MVSLANNETSLVSLMTRKKVYEVKVRTGDAAKYGDNVSENSRTTSKNEVKKKKFYFLNKEHLCNILLLFFLHVSPTIFFLFQVSMLSKL